MLAPAGSFVLPPPPPPPGGRMLAPTLAAPVRRKDVLVSAKQKTKQIQWETVPFSDLEKTVFAQDDDSSMSEGSLVKMLQQKGMFAQMEEDYKAKEIVAKLISRSQKQEEMLSFIDPKKKKPIELILKRSKALSTAEKIAELSLKIRDFDEDLCEEAFLKSLQLVLPSAEEAGKLNSYCKEAEDKLDTLHPSDQFVVALLNIPQLEARVKGMIYKVGFDDSFKTLKDNIGTLLEACDSLHAATQFKNLLKVIVCLSLPL